jgi:hypothetical protein
MLNVQIWQVCPYFNMLAWAEGNTNRVYLILFYSQLHHSDVLMGIRSIEGQEYIGDGKIMIRVDKAY